MKIIIGLGNPGLMYRHTRHNAGFMLVDLLSKRLKIPLVHRKFESVFGEGKFGPDAVYLMKPATFMNLSGKAAAAFLGQRKLGLGKKDLSGVLVACDDIDLRLGYIRIKKSGSDGGHRGLRSLTISLGTQDFARLRIGVRGADRIPDASEYVLDGFEPGEKAEIKKALEEAGDCVISWMRDGPDSAMNRFNRRQG